MQRRIPSAIVAATILGACMSLPGTTRPLQAQTGLTPPWAGADIRAQSWSDIQAYMDELIAQNAFDESPLVTDRQTLVSNKGSQKQVGPLAAIIPRIYDPNLTDQQREDGRFIGLIRSTGPQKALGIFQGETFIWVDRMGDPEVDDGWRAILFPRDRSSAVVPVKDILGPQLIRADRMESSFSFFSPPGYNVVYECGVERASIPSAYDPGTVGALWSTGLGTVQSLSSDGPETFGCVTCDHVLCCPVNASLAIF